MPLPCMSEALAMNDQGETLPRAEPSPWLAKAKALVLLVGAEGATPQELEARAYKRVFRTYAEILNALAVADGWLLEYREGRWLRIEEPEPEPTYSYCEVDNV